MKIREATEADSLSLCRLLDAQNALHAELLPCFFRRTHTEASRVRGVLEDPNAAYLVAEEDGAILGLAEVRMTQTKDLPVLIQKSFAYLQELFVIEDLRGQGIGSALMAAARHWSGERGATSMRTSVVPTNESARAFYAKHGFGEIMISLEANIGR